MAAVFALRLAIGMLAALLLLPPAQINPRFFRTHFLVVLGLATAAAFIRRDFFGWLLGGVLLLSFLGSLAWSLEGAPGGRILIALTLGLLTVLLIQTQQIEAASESAPAHASFLWVLANDVTAAAVLGSALTAMLLGHSYLLAPGMSIQPLLRMLAALTAAVLLRAAVAGWGLFRWTESHSLTNLNSEAVLWLPVRWGLGIFGPLVLGWMAWQTARIRSTQSATGILYVVVIFSFLGELTSQLLLSTTGYAL